MTDISSEVDPQVQIFSSTKYEIMKLLKADDSMDLEKLSKKLMVSQMAVYKHLRELERDGLVEHVAYKNGVGRPRMLYKPTLKSDGVYPHSYARLSLMLLEYIKDRLGREGVESFFGKAFERGIGKYGDKSRSGNVYDRARKLASARSNGAFYASVTRSGKGTIEVVQRNCPISCVSWRYPEICEEERVMFEKVLEAKVQLADRGSNAADSCRFVINPE